MIKLTYEEACVHDSELQKLHSEYLDAMKRAGDLMGKCFSLWFERYVEVENEVSEEK